MNSSPGNNSAQDNCHLGPSVGIIIDQGGAVRCSDPLILTPREKYQLLEISLNKPTTIYQQRITVVHVTVVEVILELQKPT